MYRSFSQSLEKNGKISTRTIKVRPGQDVFKKNILQELAQKGVVTRSAEQFLAKASKKKQAW